MDALRRVDRWPVQTAAVAVIGADGAVLAQRGPTGIPLPLASVTKVITAAAVHLAAQDGLLDLDGAAGPPGATVRHLLGHASGYRLDDRTAAGPPGRRRVYSNAGYEVLGEVLAAATGADVESYARERLLDPLGMRTARMAGSPASGGVASVEDLARLAAELQRPQVLHSSAVAAMSEVAFPGLDGVLPGYGVQRPNDWGAGPEVRGGKWPHWTGSRSSPATWGHFGRSGTFVWVDPAVQAACVCLTDRDFGDWAKESWPALTDEILDELGG